MLFPIRIRGYSMQGRRNSIRRVWMAVVAVVCVGNLKALIM